MTDAHCHLTGGDPTVREFLIGRDFVGVHPWEAETIESLELLEMSLRKRLSESHDLGVGEIGLDRLRSHDVSRRMRDVFELQLRLAVEFRRRVVLHGAKCWGQVVKTVDSLIPAQRTSRPIPSLLFHGFSRSDGLIPDMVRLNGFISVGPAVLNDHAVNYRELVKRIPSDRLLLETDRTAENAAEVPAVAAVAAKVAELRGLSLVELVELTDRNADVFFGEQA